MLDNELVQLALLLKIDINDETCKWYECLKLNTKRMMQEESVSLKIDYKSNQEQNAGTASKNITTNGLITVR